MNKYELMYIIRPDLDDVGREALIEKFNESVKAGGGEVEATNKWGMRRLAYPIDFKKDGYYVLMTFTSGVELPSELERQMRISDGVMRFMVIKKD